MDLLSPLSSAIVTDNKDGSERISARLLAQVAGEDSGTFKQSLRAPIHRWYSYPVGFSHTVVESAIRMLGLRQGAVVYDPFAGTATSLLAARSLGIESHGLESHPFIHFVGVTKLRQDIDPGVALITHARLLDDAARRLPSNNSQIDTTIPALLIKCYTPAILRQLLCIRDLLYMLPHEEQPYRDLGLLALSSILRRCAAVSTKWPYIRPKTKRVVIVHDALRVFDAQVRLMISDIASARGAAEAGVPLACLARGDARIAHPYLHRESVDLVFSSPPYLNNFDYADRTRLETYFLGQFRTWNEITEGVRKNLVVAATTQVSRATHDPQQLLAPLAVADEELYAEVSTAVAEIARQRVGPGKARKKNFDIMVAAYIADMFAVLRNTVPLIRPGGKAILILGDSQLYGVHVPTDTWVCRLALAAGFTSFDKATLRKRGAKWLKQDSSQLAPQLSESLIILQR